MELIISSPTRMVPDVGWSRPAIRLSNVVLPEPDGPIRARNSPSATSRFRSARTLISSLPRTNDLYSPRTRTIGSRPMRAPPRSRQRLVLLVRLEERHDRAHLGPQVRALFFMRHAHLHAHGQGALGAVGDRHEPVHHALVDAVRVRLRPDLAGHALGH